MEKKTLRGSLRNIPTVAVRGIVVFPRTEVLLTFGRQKSVSAVNHAFRGDRVIAIFTQKDPSITDPRAQDLYKIGTIATITQMVATDGEIHASVRGQTRVNLEDIVGEDPHLTAKVTEIAEVVDETEEVAAMNKQLVELFKKAVNLGKPSEVMTVMRLVSGQSEPQELVDQIAAVLDLKISEKQHLLEETSLKARMSKVIEFLSREINILEIERNLAAKTQKRFEEQMRKAMLREKKKTIEEELREGGEDDTFSEEVADLKKKIKQAKMPKEIEKKAKKELDRLIQLSPHNPEGGYIRNYLDWLVEMPWSKSSPNNKTIKHAEKTLDADHYGINKAKERILEFLAVMKIKAEIEKKKAGKSDENGEAGRGFPTILCFIGPPGVGKTSVGKSIAKSLGREFVRVSLGGVRDEAEIRGHRRTYVGAMPGRIIQGVRNAGTNNPVFMLDEIDKLGQDFRGDPSSALLEVLDPEQNKEFSDHYLEVPFDLSHVIFICTGNVLENIPPALRDRMEVIRFPGYTEDEKYHIAKQFLWPKQLLVHGLESKKVTISSIALKEIINRYTRESGVRNLERNLATVCRKIARLVAEGKKFSRNIKVADVRKFLGPRRFSSLIAEKKDEVGMVTGLAYTPTGGEILFIEVALMPGRGKLTLTGQLGDVMKESAKAAFTWAKAHHNELGLRDDFAQKIDVHIHVPEGAVPKDGPSAGIAMTVALVSALTGVPVKRGVGMTGEVTLRGRALEIGGVKEKVIAGHRAGLTTIILPKDNKKDLEDVPEKTKKDIKFVYASTIADVLPVAMTKWPAVKRSPRIVPSRPKFLASN